MSDARADVQKSELVPRLGFVKRNIAFVKSGIWALDVDRMPLFRRLGVQLMRFLSITIDGYSRHRIGLHAAGLTCFSLLSVIPVLLLMLLLTKPCGMYEWAREKLRTQTDEMIETFFEQKQSAVPTPSAEQSSASTAQPSKAKPETTPSPKPEQTPTECRADAGKEFGGQARELRDQIMGQIDAKIQAFNFGLAAVFGFAMLAWTVIGTFGQVEDSFNEIWNVGKGRPIWRKAILYVSTIMVLPLLLALAMSLPILRVVKSILDSTLGATSYTKWAGDVLVALLDSSLFSYVVTLFFSALAIAFVFKAMPKRKVLMRAALEGGLVTAVLLGVLMHVCTMVQFGIANSSAAYGSFALIPIIIVWLNLSWKVLLVGSNMTYAFQCIHSRVRALHRV